MGERGVSSVGQSPKAQVGIRPAQHRLRPPPGAGFREVNHLAPRAMAGRPVPKALTSGQRGSARTGPRRPSPPS